MITIVVKVSFSVVKINSLYVKWHFVDVLCFSWSKPIDTKGIKLKKALLLQQDPFTRTLYENEKITF